MVANALVTTRIDPIVKDEASAVLAALGLTVSDAVRLLLTKVAHDGALPFDPLVPSRVSIEAARQDRQFKSTKAAAELTAEAPQIPVTSPQRYLSGMAALNIPSSKGTGDWHLNETFFRPRQRPARLFIARIGCEGDTTALLGNRGIYDCANLLDELNIPHPNGPVYAADHARAIADLVLVAILADGSPDFVQLDDWMPADDDKQAVFDLLGIAMERLNTDQQRKVLTWQLTNSR